MEPVTDDEGKRPRSQDGSPRSGQSTKKGKEEFDEDDSSTGQINSETRRTAREKLQTMMRSRVDGNGLNFAGQEADDVNKAFENLRGRLGEAGRACVNAYERWGNKFWRTDHSTVMQGVIQSYWHQTLISEGVRQSAMRRAQKQRADNVFPPHLTTTIVRDAQDGKTLQYPGRGVFTSKTAGEGGQQDPLKIEAGHYASMESQIATYAGNAWDELVNGVIASWKTKAKGKPPKAPLEVLDSFELFLIKPTLGNWNRLMDTTLLWKAYDGWTQRFKNWFKDDGEPVKSFTPGANFVEREVNIMYKQVAAQEGHPQGFEDLVDALLFKSARYWDNINVAEMTAKTEGTQFNAASLGNPVDMQRVKKMPDTAQADIKYDASVEVDKFTKNKRKQAGKRAKKGPDAADEKEIGSQILELVKTRDDGVFAQRVKDSRIELKRVIIRACNLSQDGLDIDINIQPMDEGDDFPPDEEVKDAAVGSSAIRDDDECVIL